MSSKNLEKKDLPLPKMEKEDFSSNKEREVFT